MPPPFTASGLAMSIHRSYNSLILLLPRTILQSLLPANSQIQAMHQRMSCETPLECQWENTEVTTTQHLHHHRLKNQSHNLHAPINLNPPLHQTPIPSHPITPNQPRHPLSPPQLSTPPPHPQKKREGREKKRKKQKTPQRRQPPQHPSSLPTNLVFPTAVVDGCDVRFTTDVR